ncbi:quinone-dependent dihydroorotate dehydrogenase [Candidatus Parcubacteria bacterium]|jgi:dihydroorotate dehydrogenase|nr:quinone-dependent dihydroorotate dehydrogenase [Candidatus Parcubacteria bacterium]MBT7228249.1 quinone-dependent dihydroorotate dehydrogenase [Candidatus Parcubacteria bacterium]
MLYQKIIRPILFLFDAEKVHSFTIKYLKILNYSFFYNIVNRITRVDSLRLKQQIWGLDFKTPIGLAAGMDKHAAVPNAWPAFGFGWVQIGSITNLEQPGNPKPRLWRLPKDRGIVVYYGIPNPGAAAMVDKIKQQGKNKKTLWSVSIAKSTRAPMEGAAEDYGMAFEFLNGLGDIITINLSCPNVKDFTGLQKKEILEPILNNIASLNKYNQPIWLKIGPDLNTAELDDIIYLAKKYKVAAIVACNLSKKRDHLNLKSKNRDKQGGVSGKSIALQSNKIISYLYKNGENKYKIVGVGGIFDATDAYDKIKAGADLLQIATGFIYGGPMSIHAINKGLDKHLKQDNFGHISKAVGIEADKYAL